MTVHDTQYMERKYREWQLSRTRPSFEALADAPPCDAPPSRTSHAVRPVRTSAATVVPARTGERLQRVWRRVTLAGLIAVTTVAVLAAAGAIWSLA